MATALLAVPDDSALSDLPRGQVDYLSHQWREEDVWRSWRSMTRLKNEIANGVRLENASWRTWWKQRNGLKTVTPETLNWLKDSDVTWLYGPLHTADPVPKPSPSASATAALDLSSSPSPTFDPATGTVRKPILKHRSISELLASEFPLSPVFSPADSDDDAAPQIMSDGDQCPRNPPRPSLLHTKSDTHITRYGPDRLFRRDSPPRVDLPVSSLLQSESPPVSVPHGQKRKHISFNTFVEQCIAIDKPKKKRPHFSDSNPHFGNSCPLDDDGYDEDSEDGVIDEVDELLFGDDHDDGRPHSPSHPSYSQLSQPPHHSPPSHSVSPPSSSTSEEEEEEDVLEMRVRHNASSGIPLSPTHSTSSASSSSSRSRPAKTHPAVQRRRGKNGFIMRSPSTDKELVTIAFIAPTMLKTKLDEDDEDDEHPAYPIPHSHLPPFPHRAHDNRDWSPHDTPVELVYVPPSYIYSATEDSEDLSEQDGRTAVHETSLTVQPQPIDRVPSVTQVPVAPQEPQEISADSSIPLAPPLGSAPVSATTVERNPEVIVSSPDGRRDVSRSRSRSGSRSRSRSRTPSPNAITASTDSSASVAVASRAPAQVTTSTLLAPSGSGPLRGRSASSPSLSSQAQVEQPRGRSISRTSSFSDRESLHTGSPLGSLSPDGGVGFGIGSVGVRDRERDPRDGKRSAERGRDRFSRRSGSHSGSGSNSSLSPDDPHAAPRAVVVQLQPEQLPLPDVRKSSTSGSSSSGSSTVTLIPTTAARSPPRLVVDAKPITQTSYTEAPSTSIPICPCYAQEEQESISRQPTPANSPVLSMRTPVFPSKPSPSHAHHQRTSSGGSRSPTRGGDDVQHGTLVGRAVEIMSNAGAFLGSFWHSGTPAGVPTS